MLAQRYQKKMLKCNKNNYKSTKRLIIIKSTDISLDRQASYSVYICTRYNSSFHISVNTCNHFRHPTLYIIRDNFHHSATICFARRIFPLSRESFI